jgi:hypothetical protein
MPALLEIWLYASSRKPMFMPSTMGRSPVMAAPMPMPMKPFSVAATAHDRQPTTGDDAQHRLQGRVITHLQGDETVSPLWSTTCHQHPTGGFRRAYLHRALTTNGCVQQPHLAIFLIEVVCDLV